MIQLLVTTINEKTKPADLERVRRNLFDVVRELQQGPFLRVIKTDVVLADGVPTPIPHSLGRRAFVWVSPPRGAVAAGWIEEVRDGSHDPTKYVVLRATDYGASVTVDVAVL